MFSSRISDFLALINGTTVEGNVDDSNIERPRYDASSPVSDHMSIAYSAIGTAPVPAKPLGTPTVEQDSEHLRCKATKLN